MKAEIITTEKAMEDILALLKQSKLPYQDVRLDGNLFVAYRDEAGHLIGSGALELYGSYSLIRSIAVDETQRGKKAGQQIVADLIDRAKQKSLKDIYLLTETAHDFFIKIGFKDVGRDQVPDEVKGSSEFSSVCPVSAACMVYTL